PKKLGHRLWELLDSQVWYQTIAVAGVAELLHTIQSGPQVDSLGVSYFGNDIMTAPITKKVQADWKEFIQAVKLKSKRSVFVIGGYAAKFPVLQLSSAYDQNLQYVRSLVESEGLYVTDLRQKVQKWKLCSDGVHWHEDEKEDVCATWARLLRGQVPPSCHPDSDDFADDSEPPGSRAACWTSASRLPKTLHVPDTGFQDAEWEGSRSQKSRASQANSFCVTVFRNGEEKLGIRLEAVSGLGYHSAARVHRIFQGGLIDRWNRMQESNGLQGWAVQVDDVIVGLNGQHEFSTSSWEFQTATTVNLLIIRGLSLKLSA
ncbi:unnamed protein product, partial [Symbiodinium necroappetens]